jgi:hypothetical protein
MMMTRKKPAAILTILIAALVAGCAGQTGQTGMNYDPTLSDVVNQALIDHGIRPEGSHLYGIEETGNTTAEGAGTRTLTVTFLCAVNGESAQVEEQVVQTIRDGAVVDMKVTRGTLTNSTGSHEFMKG